MKRCAKIYKDDRGSAGIQAIIAFLILGAFIYAGIQLIPIYWDHWNLKDSIETTVQFAFVNNPKDTKAKITKEIQRLLDEISAQYEKKDLKIDVDERRKKIVVELWYWRSHKVPVYPPNPMMFHFKVENHPL